MINNYQKPSFLQPESLYSPFIHLFIFISFYFFLLYSWMTSCWLVTPTTTHLMLTTTPLTWYWLLLLSPDADYYSPDADYYSSHLMLTTIHLMLTTTPLTWCWLLFTWYWLLLLSPDAHYYSSHMMLTTPLLTWYWLLLFSPDADYYSPNADYSSSDRQFAKLTTSQLHHLPNPEVAKVRYVESHFVWVLK